MAVNITIPDVTKTINVRNMRKVCDVTIAGKSGVYVFRDDSGNVLYVGKSKDLGRRINEHLGAVPYSFDNRAVSVDVFIEPDPVSVDIYEAFMISQMKPEYNKAGMYSPEFQRQNAEELFELEVLLAEAEDEERSLKFIIEQHQESVMCGEPIEAMDLIEAIRDLGYVRKRITTLKRDIAVRKRRTYKEAA